MWKSTWAWLSQPAVRRTTQAIWTVLIILALGWYIRGHWSDFTRYAWSLAPGWALAAVGWTLVRRFLGGLRWPIIALVDERPVPWPMLWEHMRIYFRSNLAAYLPGTYWYMASRIKQTRERGYGAARTALGLVLETGLLVWSGAMVGLLTLDRLLPLTRFWLAVLAGSMALGSLLALQPRLIKFIIDWTVRLLRKPSVTLNVTWSWGWSIWALSLGIWVTWGFSLFCLLKALDPAVPATNLLDITSAYALAWVVGFITPWAPSGLGVREGLLFILLKGYVAEPVAMAAVLVSRLLIVFEDLFWAGVSLIFKTEVTAGPQTGAGE